MHTPARFHLCQGVPQRLGMLRRVYQRLSLLHRKVKRSAVQPALVLQHTDLADRKLKVGQPSLLAHCLDCLAEAAEAVDAAGRACTLALAQQLERLHAALVRQQRAWLRDLREARDLRERRGQHARRVLAAHKLCRDRLKELDDSRLNLVKRRQHVAGRLGHHLLWRRWAVHLCTLCFSLAQDLAHAARLTCGEEDGSSARLARAPRAA
mmetsp:Transcript_5481/g.16616  ORF Transcript_5481/g.16616 Transcript_5481/m.16616 type:complete len:209 (+) Transcript_5481:894-1520(+)